MAGETMITVIGNLTRDPELRTTANGSTVVNLTIASSTRTFNRDTNQWDDGDTLFINCSAWDSRNTNMASNIARSLSKGMNVIAQGRLSQHTYETETHEKHTSIELKLDAIGPNLRRGIAMFTKTPTNGGGQAQTPAAGYQGGATYQGGADGQGAHDPFAQDDPWAGGGQTFGASGYTPSTGREEEPEF
ncbi:single-stranded DNA-binding protein [Bifidobacterium animalis]|uniref:single-stranded DNA-binding protein n=1 Tax=Bifidobacterium animalis TaxID=28025 RepID=UPI00102002FB|nr:single-stranded DNA-binding protein [Bifidobacterium animalis]RYN04959.1 single-stranded DNA-binding protein [Bifidobacterium animalis subsp. lactis]